MSREITTHKHNDCNEAIGVFAVDEPGNGGAHHHYQISWPGDEPNHPHRFVNLTYQNGPIKEVGTNGITEQSLLAVIIDRMQCFQKGPYSCRENAIALTKLEEALHWMEHRTKARQSRGVEGTHEV